MRAWRKVSFLILAALVLVVAGCGGRGGDKGADQAHSDNVEVPEEVAEPGIQIVPSATGIEVFGATPEFTLINQEGSGVSSDDLLGKVVLYNFIFTNCKDACPLTSALFAQVRDELKREGLLGTKVMLVSISFDPERDTPTVLKNYSRKYGADPANWLWLTGSKMQIDRVVRDGFSQYYEKLPESQQALTRATGDEAGGASGGHGHTEGGDTPPPAGYDVDHLAMAILVDQEGKARAVYPGFGVPPEDYIKGVKDVLKRPL